LTFSSDNVNTLNVSKEGKLTAILNTAGSDTTGITATSSIQSSISDVVLLSVNLKPDLYDVDLGEKTGSQFPTRSTGTTFDVDVIINSGDYYLTGFQIAIHFDLSVVSAVKDGESLGDDWSSSTVFTYGSPSSAVLLSSVATDSTVTGSYIHVATIQFEALNEGDCEVIPEIVEILGSMPGTNSDTALAKDTTGIAGYGTFVISNSRRARHLNALSVQEYSTKQELRTKRRSMADACIMSGDVTDDCSVTISDLALTLRYISDSDNYVDLNIDAMDVDYNDKVDIIDALFLQYTIAKKYRFLDDTEQYAPKLIQNGCMFRFSVRLVYDTGLPVDDSTTTQVLIQIGNWSSNIVSVNSSEGATFFDDHEDGVVLKLGNPDSNGIFAITFNVADDSLMTMTGVDIAMMVFTYEDDGFTTDQQRRFPWYGTAWGEFGIDGSTFKPFIVNHPIIPTECSLETESVTPTAPTSSIGWSSTMDRAATSASLSITHITSEGTTMLSGGSPLMLSTESTIDDVITNVTERFDDGISLTNIRTSMASTEKKYCHCNGSNKPTN
jgi:hypothetical protein